MISATKLIRIEPDSELGRLLEEAGDMPVVLEKNGERYRLTREAKPIWSDYDAEAVKAAVRKTAGAWADLDTARLIADLYHARETGSRPTTRP